MSVTQNPVTGRMKQKMGGVVFTTWKGINVMKGKPLTVANPRTDAQLMRRSALQQITAIARVISAVIQLGFKEQAVLKSAFNAFVGYNLRNAFDYSAPPDATIIKANILTSQGTISTTPIASLVASVGGGNTTITWNPAGGSPGQSANDLVLIVLLEDVTNVFYGVVTAAVRSDGTVDIPDTDFPLTLGHGIRAFLTFYNTTSRKASDSVTATAVIGA